MDYQNVPNLYRPIPFWSWNEKLSTEETRRQINLMHDVGIGGFFMHARGGLKTEYLSEAWMECISACADEAEKLCMDAWVYDENGWPSGFGDGIVPALGLEHQQKSLRFFVWEKESAADFCEENINKKSPMRIGDFL